MARSKCTDQCAAQRERKHARARILCKDVQAPDARGAAQHLRAHDQQHWREFAAMHTQLHSHVQQVPQDGSNTSATTARNVGRGHEG